MKRILIIAGESSGDLHGSSLMSQIKTLMPDCEFRGIGGTLMIREGLTPVRHVRDMNFMGLTEVIRHLPYIHRTLKELESLVDSWRPDLVILIDYPGFNLKFVPFVKQRNIPVMYYISPQLWAWHSDRVKLVKKYVDRMVVLFNFERDFYRRYGIDADFVGHPLLDIVYPSRNRDDFRTLLEAGDSIPLIGLFPGSRLQEIDRILPLIVQSIAVILRNRGVVRAALGCASEIDDKYYHRFIKNTDIIPLRGMNYDLMAYADVLVVTSGTATLEAGILGTPMVIVYRTSPLTYCIGRVLVRIPDIGLINVVGGSRIVPELKQNEVTPERIAGECERFLTDVRVYESVKKALGEARARLGEHGASLRAAQIAVEML